MSLQNLIFSWRLFSSEISTLWRQKTIDNECTLSSVAERKWKMKFRNRVNFAGNDHHIKPQFVQSINGGRKWKQENVKKFFETSKVTANFQNNFIKKGLCKVQNSHNYWNSVYEYKKKIFSTNHVTALVL